MIIIISSLSHIRNNFIILPKSQKINSSQHILFTYTLNYHSCIIIIVFSFCSSPCHCHLANITTLDRISFSSRSPICFTPFLIILTPPTTFLCHKIHNARAKHRVSSVQCMAQKHKSNKYLLRKVERRKNYNHIYSFWIA